MTADSERAKRANEVFKKERGALLNVIGVLIGLVGLGLVLSSLVPFLDEFQLGERFEVSWQVLLVCERIYRLVFGLALCKWGWAICRNWR